MNATPIDLHTSIRARLRQGMPPAQIEQALYPVYWPKTEVATIRAALSEVAQEPEFLDNMAAIAIRANDDAKREWLARQYAAGPASLAALRAKAQSHTADTRDEADRTESQNLKLLIANEGKRHED